MPKSKKKKKQDFQKVKLKVGKKLPKGDNVMNLSFKTRHIHLTQRIKDDEGQDLVTKKKLSVQELLRQCDHHSSSARVNAVAGLKELWLSNQAELMILTNAHGYGEILKKLSTLLLDSEAVVRHSVINLFKLMLHRLGLMSTEGITSDKLGGSLFSHLHAYLCCAMNHVHEEIKLDALVLFDTLLDSFPHLMVQQTGDVLKNLIGLISSPAYLAAKADSTTQRLSLNPDSKLPAMKFRAKVLLRMKRIFMEALNDEARKFHPLSDAATGSKERVWSLFADHCGSNTKQNTFLQMNSISSTFQKMFFGGCHELDDYITKPSSLQSFLKLSIPVLLQCWKEAQASVDAHATTDHLVSADSVEVMSLVMCVIQLMFVLCRKLHEGNNSYHATDSMLLSPKFLVMNYRQDFEKLFMNEFPYTAQVQVPSGKKRKKHKGSQVVDSKVVQASVVALNLAVCDVMSSFCCDPTVSLKQSSLKKVDSYIVRHLQKSPSPEQCRVIVRVIQNMFSNPQTRGKSTPSYQAALKYYLACTVTLPQKQQLYSLFASMTQNWKGWKREGEPLQLSGDCDISAVLEKFCADLPVLLLDVMKAGGDRTWLLNILTLMSHGHVVNHSQTFRKSLLSYLTDFLDPAKGVIAYDDELVQQRLCHILSLGFPLTEQHLRHLLKAIRRPFAKPVLHSRKSRSVACHAIYSVIAGIKQSIPLENQADFNKMTMQQHTQLSDFLRFMFSLQIGMTAEELDEISPVDKDTEKGQILEVDFIVQGDQWTRHMEISNLAARELINLSMPALPSKGYHQHVNFLQNLQDMWHQTLANRQKIHVLSAYSLILFFYQASRPHMVEKPGQEFYTLAAQVTASLLTDLHRPDKTGLTPSEEMVWQIKSDMIQCLTQDLHLLDLVLKLLKLWADNSVTTPEQRQGSKTAIDFLLSDEMIKLKVEKCT